MTMYYRYTRSLHTNGVSSSTSCYTPLARSVATYKTRVILRNLDFYRHPDCNAVSMVIFFMLCRENIFFGNFIKYYI